jgi:hypothetical protein
VYGGSEILREYTAAAIAKEDRFSIVPADHFVFK